MRDDVLVPMLFEALVATGQAHVARMLGYEGLHTLLTMFSTLQGFVFVEM